MGLFSNEDTARRDELRAARRDLNAQPAAAGETDEFLAANERSLAAREALPWWKRADIDLTS